ncbi:MAG TPA: response regulator [Steroidobacteraceae bacterium]|nr:response regulator [Steroidobacteraceae bacterium]
MTESILIVDDNPLNLKLATEVLAYEGYSVQGAGDAEQAQRMLLEHVPDLILMDIALPDMDGLALTRKLKADARFQRIPVVALTAFAMKGDEQKAFDAGCDGYITKPIDTRNLSKLVARYLSQGARPQSVTDRHDP